MIPRGRSATFARLVVALAVLAFSFADLFRGVHLLAERHVVCAEHGELVHAGERAEPNGPNAGGPTRVDPAAPGAHHHDHCGLAAFSPRESHALVSAAPRVFVTALAERVLAAPELASVPAAAVLAYAPKLSPPV